MSLELVDASPHKVHYYSSSLGSLVVFAVTCYTFSQTLYHFYRNKRNATAKRTDDRVYHLFFFSCIGTMYICMQYAFGRSNLITQQLPHSFTHLQCSIVHWSQHSIAVLSIDVTYALFIYRIKIVFERSAHAISKRTITAMYAGLIVVSLLVLLCLLATASDIKFVLFYFDSNNNVYCDSNGSKSGSPRREKIIKLGMALFFLLQIAYNVILSYIFTKRLYLLQTDLVEQMMLEMAQMHEYNSHSPKQATKDTGCATTAPDHNDDASKDGHSHSASVTITPADSTNDEPETVTSEPDPMSVCPSASSSGTAGSATATSLQSRVSTETDPAVTDPVEPVPVEPDSKENEIENIPTPTFARQCTVDVLVEATKKNDQSAKRMLTLHNLIMKFTILVWIQILVSVSWLAAMYLYSLWMLLEIHWVLMVNNICVWMTFNVAERYYRFITKCCPICCFCY